MDMSMGSMSMPTGTAATTAATAASSSMSGMSSMDMMTPYLHFTGGDNLYFKTWMPSSHGAIAGACIALIAIAIFERWISAMRGLLAGHWRRRAFGLFVNRFPADESVSSTPTRDKNAMDIEEVNAESLSGKLNTPVFSIRRSPRIIEPFILSHDLPRGIIYALQALLAYVLMLAVMTFQAAFIISIVAGLGIGEVLFGRMGGVETHLLH